MNDKPDPWAQWRNMSRRKKIFVYGGLGFFAFVLLTIIIAPPPPPEKTEVAANDDNDAKEETTTLSAENKVLQKQFLNVRAQLYTCESGLQSIIERSSEAGDDPVKLQEIYGAAKNLVRECETADRYVNDIKFPKFPLGDLEEFYEPSVNDCKKLPAKIGTITQRLIDSFDYGATFSGNQILIEAIAEARDTAGGCHNGLGGLAEQTGLPEPVYKDFLDYPEF